VWGSSGRGHYLKFVQVEGLGFRILDVFFWVEGVDFRFEVQGLRVKGLWCSV